MPILRTIYRRSGGLARPKKLKDFLNDQPIAISPLPLEATQTQSDRTLKATPQKQSISPLTDPENKGQRQTGVNFDVLGSWNNRLDLQVNIQQSIKRGSLIPKISLVNVGSATLLGRRKENEDRHIACEVKPGLLLFGVFDGHGGSYAADYTKNHIVDHITFWVERGERDLGKVLHKAFIDLNNTLTRQAYKGLCNKGGECTGGTTATVCLLHNDVHLHIGHVGDSRALLCRDGKAIKLTRDHVPDDELEAARVQAEGGFVTWSSVGRPRVNGILEMTRSIGDLELKPVGVTAEPNTYTIRVKHSHDAFLVLCTDGIHHVLNSQELVDVICPSNEPKEAAKFATEQALLFGSEDNCTAVIVPFGAWGKFTSNKFRSGFTRSLVGSRVH